MIDRRRMLGLGGGEEPGCRLPDGWFPDVVLLDHDGRRHRFWSDLLRGRTVLVHFLPEEAAATAAIVANLAAVQALLGDRSGRDVLLLSLSGDPRRATPEALRRLATAHAAGPGWRFLTGEPAAIELLRSRLFVHGPGVDRHAATHVGHGAPAAVAETAAPIAGEADCSRGLLRYGNAAVGLWGAVPCTAEPAAIVERLSWVTRREPPAGPPRRRGPLALALALAFTASLAAGPSFGQHPHPQPLPGPSCQSTAGDVTTVVTGEGPFAPSQPFVEPPGTNLLPTVYTDLFDGLGRRVPNTLPSTPTAFYNLHAAAPVVTPINPTSPTDDLHGLWNRLDEMGERGGPRDPVEAELLRAAIQNGIDVLEGNPVRNRAYSGFPLLHYTGPEKIKRVEPVVDASGQVIGGNVDVHQVWYDSHFESDTAMLDVSALPPGVPWTVTYTLDVLARGEDDFSPYAMYWDLVPGDAAAAAAPGAGCLPPAPSPPGKRPGMGMDQTFFPLREGTRTVLPIRMAPAEYYRLVYTWGWRMHPPRVQVMVDAHEVVAGKTLAQWEIDVFGPAPRASEEAKLRAIAQLGELAPEKRMWSALREAREAAARGDWSRVQLLARRGRAAFEDWRHRSRLPAGVTLDREADLTLFYVNNTIYAQFTDGGLVDFPAWQTRGAKLRVKVINGDHYERAYLNVDFGGARGWENQFKSSVRVGGSGCWFTFGRNYWWVNMAAPVVLPPARRDPYRPAVHEVHVTYRFDPGRRLRFYQFDPLHHDVGVYSIH
jgi:hypothetical protein